MHYEVPHYINGQSVSIKSRTLNIYDPVKGVSQGELHVATEETVDAAVAAAQMAFLTWSHTTPIQRANFLFRYKALLEANINSLAKLISQEHGKTISEAIGSLQRGIDVVDFTCGIAHLLKGSFTENVARQMDCYSLHQPLGVCAGITPFNFPGMIPLWMFPMAIACGNTFILKPSEKNPSCAIRLVELLTEAGVPNGVVNIVNGDKETVDLLVKHTDIKAISFVGSTVVAEQVQHQAIQSHKRVQAFGGAKNHCIVMPDADIDQAAPAIVASAYGSAGERCMAISVVVAVGDVVADALINKMSPLIKNLKIGDGQALETELGPLITEAHLARVKSYIDIGQAENATLLIDGRKLTAEKEANGFFMGASLFDHVLPSMRIYQEEIFGPVLCIVRVNHFTQALQLINEHAYGNGTSIYTNSGYTAREFAEQVQVGMVGINVPIPVPVAYQSFGGWKRSIFADIGMYGIEGIRFYTKLKTVTQRWFPQEKST